MTSYCKSVNVSWPLATLPDFQERVTLDLAEANTVASLPIVLNDSERNDWAAVIDI
jgi:hypothetical protein